MVVMVNYCLRDIFVHFELRNEIFLIQCGPGIFLSLMLENGIVVDFLLLTVFG